jgi:hypothetical protein
MVLIATQTTSHYSGGIAAVIQVFGLICLVALSLHLAFYLPQIVMALSGLRSESDVHRVVQGREQEAHLNAPALSTGTD